MTILDVNPKRLEELEDLFDGRVRTIMSNPLNIEMYVKESDLVIEQSLFQVLKLQT